MNEISQQEMDSSATVTDHEIRGALGAVVDPLSGADIVTSGMISEILITDGDVQFAIEVPSARAVEAEPIRKAAETAVSRIPGVSRVLAALTNADSPTPANPRTSEPGPEPEPAPLPEAEPQTGEPAAHAPTDQFLLDGHKLHWHLDRVNQWMRGETIAPLYIDMGITQTCNIHCQYCYYAVPENRTSKTIPTDALVR